MHSAEGYPYPFEFMTAILRHSFIFNAITKTTTVLFRMRMKRQCLFYQVQTI